MGDVIGDLSSRGHIQAMDERSGARVIRALVPLLGEMFGYVGDLQPYPGPGGVQHAVRFVRRSSAERGAEEIIKKARGE